MKRFGRTVALIAACAVAGCSKGRPAEHPVERHTAEPAPPTPDTTPVAVLRTPAGLVLGTEGTPAPVPPTPARSEVPPPQKVATPRP